MPFLRMTPAPGDEHSGLPSSFYQFATHTPYEKLKSLPEAAVYLTPGTTFQQLDAVAFALSDNDAARALHEARARLFRSIDPAA